MRRNIQLNSSDARLFWQSQTEEWDCWINSLAIAFKYYGINYQYSDLLRPLLSTTVKISISHGGFFPYIAIIAANLGYRVDLHCPTTAIYELNTNSLFDSNLDIDNDKYVQAITDIQQKLMDESSPRYYLYTALIEVYNLQSQVKMHIHTKVNKPSLIDIIGYVNSGLPVIVNTKCSEYYGVTEDDGCHVLTLIPVNDSKHGFYVLDGYTEKGAASIKQWDELLIHANGYDWSTWSNWMLSLQAPTNAAI